MEECMICGKTGDGILCTDCLSKGLDEVIRFAKGPGKYVGAFVLGVYIGKKICKKSQTDK